MLKGSTWLIPTQIGAFLSYISFGWLADRLGRRPAFSLYVVVAAALVPIYGAARSETTLLVLGPLITHRIPFARAAEAYELVDQRPEETVQVILTYD